MQDIIETAGSRDKETASLKIPPHSIEAEIAVLGGVLTDNSVWERVIDRVLEDDFYRKDHRIIFNAIYKLDSHGHPIDVVTVAEWLDNHKLLEDAGGLNYLAALADSASGSSNINTYADIVRKRSVLRQLITATNRINDTVFNPEGRSTEKILDYAEQTVFEIAEQEGKGRKGYQPIKDLLVNALDRVDELFRRDSHITGVPTGFDDFDDKTAGLQGSDLIIIAGRPSMGKTAFAINIAEHAAIKSKLSVAVFSMEMPGEQLAMRMMSSLGRIDQHKVRTGKLHDDDWPRLTSAVEILKDARLFIDDTPALTPAEIRARSRRIKRQAGLDLIIVDYLQLMQVPGTNENRATEISEISRSLKAMAKELNVPVVALSQLNRSLEQRPNKRPVMSDLRESGAIEQDADVIVFIYRDEVYNEDSPDKGRAEIIIGKQRNGPIGMLNLAFLGQYTRFENYIPEPSYMPRYDE
ncbi:MAG: replicative DNA helicase [Gammaproteobacteria bacterium]|nr:replicative DNA helicase [Gammaproteobacteria bacterium]NIQ10898.1 replicative DNA helicase [Gammaproteobacteria bacterium]NIQ76471.1 replicative DNA helicase [Gammaproteobacteria bacterium]NIR27604.1 replicative DNA helicase [Gammaproteobacteria bacterium]NIR94678.1 replicative DNA helicase [Gammaproteobacteria bacterium]